MRIMNKVGLLRKLGITALIAGLLCASLAPLAAKAGPEGVYLGDRVYFTLDKVRLSQGADDAILRFAVTLHNGGDTSVDFNYYGVRVTDSAGFGYSAQLTGTQSARVLPGEEREFAYESRLAKGLQADGLRVVVFGWTYGATTTMNDIGSFSVSYALQEEAGEAQEAEVPLAQADASLPADARVAFRVGSEYTVYADGAWNVYADLLAANLGDSGFVLPAGLKLRLENAAGQTVTATAIDGADKSLLPGQPQRVTVHAAIPDSETSQGWSLQFYTANGETETVLDSLELDGSPQPAAIGDARTLADSQGRETVSVRTDSALVSQSDEGQWVRATVTAANNGDSVVAVPVLSASFQSKTGGVAVAASDTETHAAYLSQGETESFAFSALLPKGLSVGDLQLVLFETRGAAASSSGGSSNSPDSSSAAETSAGSGGTTVPALIVSLEQAQIYSLGAGADYTPGEPIDLALDRKFEVAITELALYDNENYGFKTAVAKLKITNTDNTAYALPELALDAVDENGRVYTGTRQANVISQLATNSSYFVTYSFIMPEAEEGRQVALRLYDGGGSVPLGAVRLALGPEDTSDSIWDVYPYRIAVNYADLLVGQLGTTFSYTLKLDVNAERKEQIIADASVSELQFEIEDSSGLVLSTQTLPFQGATKLLNGDNTITFTNLKLDQYNSTNYVNVYEIVETPNGTVKRKLGELR